MADKSNRTRPGAETFVEIERILPGGVGLAHTDDRTVFVALAAPGDRVRVRIDQIRGKVGFASILDVVEPSPSRVSPACAYFGRCGGCDFQQLSYEAQLNAKVEIIRDCFRRIAHVDLPETIQIIPSPNPWQYRSSAQWKYDPHKKHLGYFERGSHNICDVVECPILVPALQETLDKLRERMRDGTLPQNVSEYEAVAGDDGISMFPPIDEVKTRDVSVTIGSDRYEFSADSFFQINHEILPALIEAATKDAHGDTALDLYCGAGLFTVPLSRNFARVIGVEGHLRAVDFARRNLSAANLSNAAIECATVGDWLCEKAASLASVDFILLDPPRSGVEKRVIEDILNLRPKRITYVSCDPATLARDIKPIIANGYSLDSVVAFDMFPQTHHVETVACLSASWSVPGAVATGLSSRKA